jgi:hypothetical protein
MQHRVLLSVLLPALASFVHADYCNSREINSLDVGSCSCAAFAPSCTTTCAPECTHSVIRFTKHCSVGCTDNDWNCKGCGIWFHTLCDCIQRPDLCPHTGTVKIGGDMMWFLLDKNGEKGTPLVTTTDILPGILEMARNPGRYEEGWIFAQRQYTPKNEALALNSQRSRTHEQFHIHLCKKPQHKVYDILSTASPNPSGQLKPVKGHEDLYCMSTPQAPLKGFATAIRDALGQYKKICKELAGAGLIQDNRGNIWGCLTTDPQGPEPAFCV